MASALSLLRDRAGAYVQRYEERFAVVIGDEIHPGRQPQPAHARYLLGC
jgi:hypothetical protein